MSLLISMQYTDSHASSFVLGYPCDLDGADTTPVALELLVWLCTYPSWSLHLLLPVHLYKTSMILKSLWSSSFVLGQPVIIMFLGIVGVHPALMLAGFVILRCFLGCLSHFVLCLFLYSYLWWACLSPPHGCVGITICNENLRPRFVYNLDPVLMNF